LTISTGIPSAAKLTNSGRTPISSLAPLAGF
jgi:hypothetical protein